MHSLLNNFCRDHATNSLSSPIEPFKLNRPCTFFEGILPCGSHYDRDCDTDLFWGVYLPKNSLFSENQAHAFCSYEVSRSDDSTMTTESSDLKVKRPAYSSTKSSSLTTIVCMNVPSELVIMLKSFIQASFVLSTRIT